MNGSTLDSFLCSAHPEAALRYLGCDASGFHVFNCPECPDPALIRWRSPGIARAFETGVFDQSVDDAGDDGADGLRGRVVHTAEDEASGMPDSNTGSTENTPKGDTP